ncbi:MAG: ParB N-terminal domain-containing protein [Rhodocyclaceae bacterium]|nr:ParB N-terminal domain-containing protein [Rhodocyclaceae bacterium]
MAPALESIEGEPPQNFIELALGQFAPDDEDKGASTTFSSLESFNPSYKGLINPIVVTPQTDGTYIVIEGNTRVSIYRQLGVEKAPGSWDTIPAIVRPDIKEDGEHAIRLQAHLVGPRQWRPYAKAKYLHSLYTENKLSINEILDFCGGNARKREIEEYIGAYEDMQSHYVPVIGQNQPDYSRFSAFVELQKPQVKQSIVKAGFTMDDFAHWVNDSKISP